MGLRTEGYKYRNWGYKLLGFKSYVLEETLQGLEQLTYPVNV